MSKVALRVYNREIETLIDQGHLEEAIAHCQHILKIYPKHLESYRLLGKAYLESRRHNDAADIFQRVIASVPDDFVSQLGMSIVRDEQKDLDGAIWHMERAYEVNPSNGAVQGELRRLYGRRDGMEPPKIRLTRGALAQMYAKGGQYQQAIAEIKSVLSEDPTRLDMRILMARALYRGGQKVEATDICMDLLKQSPFFLDANRILLDVLPGNQDVYRKRIEALEPYATQAKGSTFELDTIPDNAITIDRLDWDPDAAASSSVGSATKGNDALPDFLSNTGWGPSTGEFQDGPVDFGDDEPASPAANAAGLAAADIPDWLKAMAPPGASAALEEPDTASNQNVDDADLDWLSGLGGPIASATSQPAAPKTDQPDWLSDLGGADSTASFEPQATPQNTSSNNQPDWLNDLGAPTGDNTTAAATDDSLDWLQALHETPSTPTTAQPDVTPAAAQNDDADMDWLQNLGLPQETAPSASAPNTPQPPAAEENEDMDWLQGLGLPQTESPSASIPASQPLEQPAADDSADMDWLQNLGLPQTESPSASVPASQPIEQPAADDSADMDWLQGLGLPQTESPSASIPASQPVEQSAPAEDIADADMDWLKNLGAPQAAAPVAPASQTPPAAPPPQPTMVEKKKFAQDDPNFVPPPLSELVSGPGTSESEQDDAMKWLEALAAKQGAKAEELITKPEDRTHDAPTWVAPTVEQPAAPVAPVAQTPPPAPTPAPEPPVEKKKFAQDDPNFVPPPLSELVSGPGTSESEQDDAMKWLEALAAKQGAKAEELITKPEERTHEAPTWVAPTAEEPAAPAGIPASFDAPTIVQKRSIPQEEPIPAAPPVSESAPAISASEQDDAMKWLEALAANQPAQAEEPSAMPAAATMPTDSAISASEQDDAMKWLESLSGTQAAPAETPVSDDAVPDWAAETLPMDLTPAPSQPEPVAAEDDTMSWLQNLGANEPVADQAQMEDEEVPASAVDFSAPVEPMPWEQEEAAAPPIEKMPWEEEEQAAPVAKAEEPADVSAWLQGLDAQEEPPTTPAPVTPPPAPVAAAPDAMPDWMNSKQQSAGSDDDLPDWLKDSSGDEQPGSPLSTPEWVSDTDETAHLIFSPPLEKTPPPPPPAPAPVPAATRVPTTPLSPPPPPPAPVRPAVRQTGMLGDKDGPALQNARQLMAHGSMDAAISGYSKLIKRSKFLEEVIYDLKEATYSHPVDAIIWQTLGDAHMRANQLQDALDAYTRAEELIR
jgi:tetratricopeptide (TPR) repeat protein/uncharacterized protein Smg (DUF494 family)